MSRVRAFSAAQVTAVLQPFVGLTKAERKRRWLEAVAVLVTGMRTDLADVLLELLGVEAAGEDVLDGLTIGEIGVCYEALLALDAESRRNRGQFFTPDDVAEFMAERQSGFGEGMWVDPCCGVGNLAWHLAAQQEDPSTFVRDSLLLMDYDSVALRTAVALIAAEYARQGDVEAVRSLAQRAVRRDFLSRAPLPAFDYAILNPPYARTDPRPDLETGTSRDQFAYFLEVIGKHTKGFIAVTPAAYLAAPKYLALREVLERDASGGDVFVFDNVPDTLFRGYKFGSTNTSKTNFVRAAITVCRPDTSEWRVTPILRWKAESRARMFDGAAGWLGRMRHGPDGEWAKVGASYDVLWQRLVEEPVALQDLLVTHETEFRLDVSTTPRYYISAAFRELDRGSKVTLYFATEADRDRAAVVLNSSLPYFWWRALDGGVTLPRRVLLSTPIPEIEDAETWATRIRAAEATSIVTKLNAGKINENVKHTPALVAELNEVVFGETVDFTAVYSSDMFER